VLIKEFTRAVKNVQGKPLWGKPRKKREKSPLQRRIVSGNTVFEEQFFTNRKKRGGGERRSTTEQRSVSLACCFGGTGGAGKSWGGGVENRKGGENRGLLFRDIEIASACQRVTDPIKGQWSSGLESEVLSCERLRKGFRRGAGTGKRRRTKVRIGS